MWANLFSDGKRQNFPADPELCAFIFTFSYICYVVLLMDGGDIYIYYFVFICNKGCYPVLFTLFLIYYLIHQKHTHSESHEWKSTKY